MHLIVTHTNADFDALGSVIAAKKLYPHSRLLLPGSPERAVREFLSIFKDVIRTENESECRLDDIDGLVIVDTRHKSRIGIAARLIDEKGIRPIIYDHHPRTEYDIPAKKDFHRELGATITILLEFIKRKRINLSPIEATILLLGIYEETGSLTFRTTTKQDVDAVSFLLSHGARLAMVSSYLNRELSEEELAFLVRLINSTSIYNVNGVKVAVSLTDAGSYVGELATIANKLADVENMKVIFVLVKTDSRINIVARSHIQDVDVNRILKHFGGGGHAAAASAKVFREDIEGLKSELLGLLKKTVRVRICARDIMSPAAFVTEDTKVKEVKRLLRKRMLEGAAVISRKGAFLGIINAGNVNKAIRRRFSHARVKGYMLTKVNTVTPDTPLYKVQELLAQRNTGILPVLRRRRVAGLIRRNDLLKVLYRGLIIDKRIRKRGAEPRPILNLARKMESTLPRRLIKLLRFIGDMAHDRRYAAFAVGGFTRDLIMGVRNFDIDIVIEGNAVEFAREFAFGVKGSLVVHRKFGTATVVMHWGLARKERFKVDIATARRERYQRPAALPDVESSSLKNDLSRRDFTINAMAVALNRNNFGQLVDFFGGQRHLREGVISVLHEGSFIDDPTRIFRAVRFEQRFGFKIDEATENLIKRAIKQDMFGRTEKQRIRDELILMLKEDDPARAIRRMHQLDELRFIHPRIKLKKETLSLFKSVMEVCQWYKGSCLKKRTLDTWLIYLVALFENLDARSLKALCEHFAFRRADRLRIISYKKNGKDILRFLSQKRHIPPSEIYKKLHPLSYEVLLLIMAKAADRAKARAMDFLLNYNKIRIKTRGDELERLGYTPGPALGRALDKILYAKIEGKIRTKKEELLFARKLLR